MPPRPDQAAMGDWEMTTGWKRRPRYWPSCSDCRLGLRWHGAESQWVHADADGKLVYQTTPAGDRIMDFSNAGYMGGGVALPTVSVRRTVKPSAGPDDTPAIQTAIDAVAAMNPEGGFRGAVLLAPGTYTCSRTISISADGVVLRGSGTTGPGTARSRWPAHGTAPSSLTGPAVEGPEDPEREGRTAQADDKSARRPRRRSPMPTCLPGR